MTLCWLICFFWGSCGADGRIIGFGIVVLLRKMILDIYLRRVLFLLSFSMMCIGNVAL